jgi:hypothetical protein
MMADRNADPLEFDVSLSAMVRLQELIIGNLRDTNSGA